MIEVTADERTFRAASRALDEEATGSHLRADLEKNLYDAVRPAIGEVRSRLMSASSGGLPHEGEPLRAAIAQGVSADIRTSGRMTGVRLRARKLQGLRNFLNAPKRFNEGTFRHRVFGRNVWVYQIGAPKWFDGPLSSGEAKYRRRVEDAVSNVVQRLARKG